MSSQAFWLAGTHPGQNTAPARESLRLRDWVVHRMHTQNQAKKDNTQTYTHIGKQWHANIYSKQNKYSIFCQKWQDMNT